MDLSSATQCILTIMHNHGRSRNLEMANVISYIGNLKFTEYYFIRPQSTNFKPKTKPINLKFEDEMCKISTYEQ